jgi:hypothetical protein
MRQGTFDVISLISNLKKYYVMERTYREEAFWISVVSLDAHCSQ